MHNNYTLSIGKGMNHIHARYFFVVDKIKKKESRVACCPTDKIIADYSTKSTQGILFVLQCNTIQGINEQDFGMHKAWYQRVLERHGLWDNADKDLSEL